MLKPSHRAIDSTRKACSPAAINQEARYFRALERSQRWLRRLVFASSQPLKFT
ncbi:MAG: hypothetical protein RBJ76_24240 [Stenomitos frigidus ULC029]